MVTPCVGLSGGKFTCRRPIPGPGLRHAAGKKTADRNPERAFDRPDHRPAGAVWLGDHGIIRYVDPFAFEAHAVVAVPGFPIDVGDGRTIGVGAARSLSASEAVEPWLERRSGVTAIIAGHGIFPENDGCANQRNGNPEKFHAAHPATNLPTELQTCGPAEVPSPRRVEADRAKLMHRRTLSFSRQFAMRACPSLRPDDSSTRWINLAAGARDPFVRLHARDQGGRARAAGLVD